MPEGKTELPEELWSGTKGRAKDGRDEKHGVWERGGIAGPKVLSGPLQ